MDKSKSFTPENISFCIKTIHRPWACHRLVESLRRHFDHPKIVIVDDGRPELLFSAKYPLSVRNHTAICAADRSSGNSDFASTAFIRCDTQEVALFLRDQVTVCIKTIHRPQCCAALVRSIHEHYGTNRPTIHVLDDGKPDLRFSSNYPVEAAMVEQIIETEYDIGLSAGRNRLLDAGDTPFVVFADDDHLVTPRTRLPELVDKLGRHNDIDLLAALSNDEERPRLLRSNGRRLRIYRGVLKQRGSIRWCHYVGNCFVAHRDILQAIRWDDSLKVEEHWDFFWRCKIAGVNVACDISHSFKHEHIDPPGYQRNRPQFLERGLKKHGLEKVIWR